MLQLKTELCRLQEDDTKDNFWCFVQRKRLLDLIITHNPLKPVKLETAVRENERDLPLVKDYSHHIVMCAPADPAPSHSHYPAGERDCVP